MNEIDITDMMDLPEFSKSNFLISAKYKATLLEVRILAIALSRVQEDNGTIFAEIKASELKKRFNYTSGSFYTQLDRTAANMTGRIIGMSNPATQEFDYAAVITRATYKKGVFTIKFNPELKDIIINLKSNFTKLPLNVLLNLEDVYGFKLYEIIRSNLYKSKCFTMTLPELRFFLGVANAEDKNVKPLLSGTKKPDYEKALEIAKEKTYTKFGDFEYYILKPAVDDINKNSDLNVTYAKNTYGKGGIVYQIQFFVEEKKIIETKENKKEINKDEVIDEIFDLIDIKLKKRDYIAIAEAADYDIQKVFKAYTVLQNCNSDIDNVTGFLIKAIQEEYEEPIKQKKNNNKKNTSFSNFKQRQIDFDELEKNLLSN